MKTKRIHWTPRTQIEMILLFVPAWVLTLAIADVVLSVDWLPGIIKLAVIFGTWLKMPFVLRRIIETTAEKYYVIRDRIATRR